MSENELNLTHPEDLDDYLDYLDALRESGATNIFGAGYFLEEEFGLGKREARAVLSHWMRTFGERHDAA